MWLNQQLVRPGRKGRRGGVDPDAGGGEEARHHHAGTGAEGGERDRFRRDDAEPRASDAGAPGRRGRHQGELVDGEGVDRTLGHDERDAHHVTALDVANDLVVHTRCIGVLEGDSSLEVHDLTASDRHEQGVVGELPALAGMGCAGGDVDARERVLDPVRARVLRDPCELVAAGRLEPRRLANREWPVDELVGWGPAV